MNTPSIPAAHPALRRRFARALRAAACCACTLAPLTDATALSLGRIQGTPLLGRALQVAVPVTLHRGEDLACVRAELQQPELSPVPLATGVEAAGDGRALLRLSTASLVVEPIVTVKVVVGCQDQLTHSYALLADPPPSREVLPVLPAPMATPAPVAEAARAAAPAPRARKPVPARRAEATVKPGAKAVAGPRVPARPGSTEPGKPRLKVEPIEVAGEAPTDLKPSAAMTPPEVSAMTRPEATAARDGLQAALDPQAAAAREAAVQAELRKLREQLQHQSGQLEQLNEQRELERNIAAGLAAALALALGALLWRRSRAPSGRRRWWQASRPAAPATSVLPSSLFPSWAFDSAAPDSVPAVAAAAQLAAQAGTTPADERTQVLNAAELAAAIQSVAPAAPTQEPAAGHDDHPDLDLDFSAIRAGLEPADTQVPADPAMPLAPAEPLEQVSAPPPPEPTPPPHEIDWEAPVLPEAVAPLPEPATPPAAAMAVEAPMLPELDFGSFDGESIAVAASPIEAAAPGHAPAPSPGPAGDNGLDFDLDLDLPGLPDDKAAKPGTRD